MPPIRIRMSQDAKERMLGANGQSIIDSLQKIPVYTYIKKTVYDDINYYGCHYTDQFNSYHFPRNDTYANVSQYILPVVRDPMADAFNKSQEQRWNMSFNNFYDLGDVLLAENFEGDRRRYNFTDEEWYYIRLIQKYSLTVTFDEKSRNLYITKQFRRPIAEMKRRVTEILNGDPDRNTLRYLIYSAHDV